MRKLKPLNLFIIYLRSLAEVIGPWPTVCVAAFIVACDTVCFIHTSTIIRDIIMKAL